MFKSGGACVVIQLMSPISANVKGKMIGQVSNGIKIKNFERENRGSSSKLKDECAIDEIQEWLGGANSSCRFR